MNKPLFSKFRRELIELSPHFETTCLDMTISRQSEQALQEATERASDPVKASGLEERGQLLRRLLTDASLVPTAEYEAALLAAVLLNPIPRVERLAGRCLFRLVEKSAADGSSSSGGVLPAVSRAIGQP